MTDDGFDIFEAKIRRRVAEQGFMRLMGAELGSLSPGHSEISVARRPELLQQNGFFHGGVTAFLIDNGSTIAAATVLRTGQLALTAEYKLNFLAPAGGERMICRSRVVKPGRALTIVEANVFNVIGDKEKHTAVALATIAVLDAKTLGSRGTGSDVGAESASSSKGLG